MSFEQHTKPVFRERHRRSMTFAFDLWSFEDVGRGADSILDRLQAGTIPCIGAWSDDEVDVLRRVASDRPVR